MPSPEDTPEDREESYPCPWPGCYGDVVLCRDNKWRCRKCEQEPQNPADIEASYNYRY